MSYIVKQKKENGTIHIYLAASRHIVTLKQARQSRIYLGILDPKTNELLVGRNTKALSKETIESLEKIGIGYSGGKAPRPGRKSEEQVDIFQQEINRLAVLECGRVNVLLTLAEASGLVKSLEIAFGRDDAMLILAIAMHEVAEGNPLYLANDWAEETCLRDKGMALSSSSLVRLTERIGSAEFDRHEFFKNWIKACGSPVSLLHDTTSLSSYARKFDMLDWGYNRDGESLPQVNLTVVFSRDIQLPLYFRLINGSIPDVATLVGTSQMLHALGLKEFSYSLDRGYFSAGNMRYLIDYSLHFVIGAPVNGKQIQLLLDRCKLKLNKPGNSFIVGQECFRHTQCEYKVNSQSAGRSHVLPAHFYFDPEKKARMSKELEITLHHLLKKANSKKFTTIEDAEDWLADEAGSYKEYLMIRKNKKELYLDIDTKVLSAREKNLGVFIVLNSDHHADKETTLRDYRSRDAIEKMFDTLKTMTGNKRIRAASVDNAEGRVFLAFIAAILHNLFQEKLRKGGVLGKYSVKEALGMLRKIKTASFSNGKTIRLEVPKRVRDLLFAIELQSNI